MINHFNSEENWTGKELSEYLKSEDLSIVCNTKVTVTEDELIDTVKSIKNALDTTVGNFGISVSYMGNNI